MKKSFIALMAGLLLSATLPTMAQHHRHTPNASVMMNQKTDKNGNTRSSMAIVAYSDTTDVDTADVDTADVDDADTVNTVWGNGDDSVWNKLSDIMQGALVPIAIIFIMFFLAPVMIIGLIIYFIIKSRRQKMELAEMAIKNGQPIPQELIKQTAPKNEDLWTKGVKKIFLGVGLIILFLFMHSQTLVGVGFLVAIYGCGQAFIAWTTNKNKNKKEEKN